MAFLFIVDVSLKFSFGVFNVTIPRNFNFVSHVICSVKCLMSGTEFFPITDMWALILNSQIRSPTSEALNPKFPFLGRSGCRLEAPTEWDDPSAPQLDWPRALASLPPDGDLIDFGPGGSKGIGALSGALLGRPVRVAAPGTGGVQQSSYKRSRWWGWCSGTPDLPPSCSLCTHPFCDTSTLGACAT